MANLRPRRWDKGIKLWLLRRRAQVMTPEELAQSALVFAPHPDDEALGCGGTILSKREAGADVGVVFMTDGSQGRLGLMAPDELRDIRHREAMAAARVLSVPEENLTFFDTMDGQLASQETQAAEAVRYLLRERQPQQIFVPCVLDGHEDHVATYRIVLRALELNDQRVTVYEYPVWLWYHYPWIPLSSNWAQWPDDLRRSRDLSFGFYIIRNFGTAVCIRDVVDRKREALAAHASQVTRLVSDPGWETLGDVAGGEFLDCFFGEHEFFRATNVLPENPAP